MSLANSGCARARIAERVCELGLVLCVAFVLRPRSGNAPPVGGVPGTSVVTSSEPADRMERAKDLRDSLHEQCRIRHAAPTNLPVTAAQPRVMLLNRKQGGVGFLTEPSTDDAVMIAAREGPQMGWA